MTKREAIAALFERVERLDRRTRCAIERDAAMQAEIVRLRDRVEKLERGGCCGGMVYTLSTEPPVTTSRPRASGARAESDRELVDRVLADVPDSGTVRIVSRGRGSRVPWGHDPAAEALRWHLGVDRRTER